MVTQRGSQLRQSLFRSDWSNSGQNRVMDDSGYANGLSAFERAPGFEWISGGSELYELPKQTSSVGEYGELPLRV